MKKKKEMFENKCRLCIGKLKDLWKALKSFALTNEFGEFVIGPVTKKQKVKLDTESILKISSNFY